MNLQPNGHADGSHLAHENFSSSQKSWRENTFLQPHSPAIHVKWASVEFSYLMIIVLMRLIHWSKAASMNLFDRRQFFFCSEAFRRPFPPILILYSLGPNNKTLLKTSLSAFLPQISVCLHAPSFHQTISHKLIDNQFPQNCYFIDTHIATSTAYFFDKMANFFICETKTAQWVGLPSRQWCQNNLIVSN